MFTLTIDGQKLDRYNAPKIYKKVRAFLSNRSSRQGFQYILIPEYHEQKANEEQPAIHMHGLCNLGSMKIVRAFNPYTGKPLTDKGKPVFNFPAWPWGFSKAVPLDGNYARATNYVSKYITKADTKIFGKRYLSSRNLIKAPEIIPLEPIDYFEFRDTAKLKSGKQMEFELYENVKLLTEVLELPGD